MKSLKTYVIKFKIDADISFLASFFSLQNAFPFFYLAQFLLLHLGYPAFKLQISKSVFVTRLGSGKSSDTLIICTLNLAAVQHFSAKSYCELVKSLISSAY